MINILISVNNQYLSKAETMLFSLGKCVKEKITVYIINSSIDEKKLNKTKKYMQKQNIEMKEIKLNDTWLHDMPLCEDTFSIEVYYRVLAQFLLPDTIDRILWLDADLIIQKDITSFYHQSFEGKKLVACCDCHYMDGTVLENKRKLGFNDDYLYFNSGVLLLNLKLLRESTSEDEIAKKSKLYKDLLRWPDQDLLNLLYANETKIVEWEDYNYQICGNAKVPNEKVAKAYIIHYTTAGKPWKPGHIFSSSKYYWRVRIKQGYFWELLYLYPLNFLVRLNRYIGKKRRQKK